MGFLSSLGKSLPVIGSLFNAADDESAANAINPVYTPYQFSPFAKQQLAAAQLAQNGRMAGAQSAQNNIMANQAGTIAAARRGATDPNQLAALIASTQGATNSAFGNLATQESQDYYGRLNNTNQALQVNTNEGDKVYQDNLQHYQEQQARKDALNKAADANRASFGNNLLKIGTAVASGGTSLFGGGQTQEQHDATVQGRNLRTQRNTLGATWTPSFFGG